MDGLPYLYTVMEYADQTLAQLLLHRALTDEEVQEMLVPVLDALAFLHERNLMQGQLKPVADVERFQKGMDDVEIIVSSV